MPDGLRFGCTPEEYRAEQTSQFISDVLRLSSLKIGESVMVRILRGPVRRDQVAVPIKRQDRDTGEWRDSWDFFTVDGQVQHYFKTLASADREVQREHLPSTADPNKIRSVFDPTSKFLFLVIPRNWDPEGLGVRVALMEAPWSVSNMIADPDPDKGGLLQVPDPMNAEMLLNGPYYFYDTLIRVTEASNVPRGAEEWRRRRYSLSVYPPANKWTSKCPVAWLKGLPEDFDYSQIYSPEDLQAIEESQINVVTGLRELARPLSHEEVLERLQKSPINIFADRNGVALFPFRDELVMKYARLRVPMLTAEQSAVVGRLTSPVHGDPGTVPPEKVEDAEVVPPDAPKASTVPLSPPSSQPVKKAVKF